MAKISVVIPVYKVEKYLSRCVGSVLAQTFKDYEIILVDDGSPDNCPKMCDEYAKRYSFIHVIHKKNGGQGQARNVALDWAFKNLDFTYITFIDSDDYIHPLYLEVLYNACVNNNVKISCCGYKYKGEFDFVSAENVKTDVGHAENFVVFESHDRFNIGVPWGRLFAKELFKDLRFPVDRFYEDGFTIYKMLFAVDKIALCNVKLYYWYQNEDSTTHAKPTPKKISDHIDAMTETICFFKTHGFQKAYKQQVNTFFYRFIENEKNNGKYKELKHVNKKFKNVVKDIIKSDKKTFNYRDYTDVYETVYSPVRILLYKILNYNKMKKAKKTQKTQKTQ